MYEVGQCRDGLEALSFSVPRSESAGSVNNRRETFAFKYAILAGPVCECVCVCVSVCRFSRVFDCSASQEEVFEAVSRGVIDKSVTHTLTASPTDRFSITLYAYTLHGYNTYVHIASSKQHTHNAMVDFHSLIRQLSGGVQRDHLCLWPDRVGQDIHHHRRSGEIQGQRTHPSLPLLPLPAVPQGIYVRFTHTHTLTQSPGTLFTRHSCTHTLTQSPGTLYTTHISYLEIYNESGYDLLDPRHEAARLEDLPYVPRTSHPHSRHTYHTLTGRCP